MQRLIPILAWLWLLGGAGASAASDPEGVLLPPVEESLPMSSSFGEYRQGHYHGGIDFSTGGREGVPVVAPRDGWIFRLRVSGVGYGKAVYFRMDDGRTVLYAHLSRFHPRLEEVVERAQDHARRYEMDLRPEPEELAFQAGDILGYSGQSGAGVPHLHAEMRVGAEASVAVNPLGRGWSVPDAVPPGLTRLLVAPAASGVLVDAGVEPVEVSLDHPRSPAFRTTGAIRVWVEAEDRAANAAYRLAPYRIRAGVDGGSRVEVVLDRFHWNWAREVEWTFHNARARRDKERWVLLEAPPGSRQKITTEFEGGLAAIEDLAPGEHVLTVEAVDLSGNRTEASVVFLLEPDTFPETLARPGVLASRILSRGPYLEIHVAADPGHPVTLEALGPDGEPAVGNWTRFQASGGWIFTWDGPSAGGSGLWTFFALGDAGKTLVGKAVRFPGEESPKEPRETWVEDSGLRLRLGPGVTYGPHWATLKVGEIWPAPSADVPDLEPRGPVLELEPWALPLRERVEVFWNPGDPDRRGLALCRKQGDSWRYAGSDTAGRGVGTSLGSLETLALFRDRVPPRVQLDPPAEANFTRFRCRIVDGGVGVHGGDLEMTLDGEAVVAEWDPESDTLTGILRSVPPRGEHRLAVRAADRVGNISRRETTFTVP